MEITKRSSNIRMLSAAMFRLLPVQLLILAVASVNSLISGWFAANYIGETAITVVGLFAPLQMLISAVGGGSSSVCDTDSGPVVSGHG